MKKLIYISCVVFTISITFAQQASDYFPERPNAWWEYKITPLDSLNNAIDSLYYFRHDKLMDETIFEGKLAKILQTKSGPAETIYFQPYLDSLFFHFSGSDGYEYFKVGYVRILLSVLDSVLNIPNFSLEEFVKSFEKWYSVYRFSQSINDEYTILQLDTSLIIDTLSLPLRFEVLAERMPDDSVSTPIGDFNCQKFVRKIGVSLLIILPPPLPPIAIPILFLEDSIWIAEGYWIIQGVIPAMNVDLSFLGIEPFFMPGLITKLANTNIVTSVEEELSIPNEITLFQNYPNPFNPSTTIKFSLSTSSFAIVKIYNAIGEEVAVLLDKELATGNYEVEWNAVGLPSGIYFYRLATEGFVETRKMILIK
ncbi:MAG: T9SS type A sorting domain-containing protein [Ignavibacteria bacterium]|nr:T9SS type A sorting domain-containing protein [Ignavibacteria bacterium]